MTHMADYSWWGLDPAGHHLTNILLHILVAMSLFWFINIVFQDQGLALFTSLLFVVHPVHVEEVAYISSRSDSIGLVFLNDQAGEILEG